MSRLVFICLWCAANCRNLWWTRTKVNALSRVFLTLPSIPTDPIWFYDTTQQHFVCWLEALRSLVNLKIFSWAKAKKRTGLLHSCLLLDYLARKKKKKTSWIFNNKQLEIPGSFGLRCATLKYRRVSSTSQQWVVKTILCNITKVQNRLAFAYTSDFCLS